MIYSSHHSKPLTFAIIFLIPLLVRTVTGFGPTIVRAPSSLCTTSAASRHQRPTTFLALKLAPPPPTPEDNDNDDERSSIPPPPTFDEPPPPPLTVLGQSIPKLQLPKLGPLPTPKLDKEQLISLAATVIFLVVVQKLGLFLSNKFLPELTAEQIANFKYWDETIGIGEYGVRWGRTRRRTEIKNSNKTLNTTSWTRLRCAWIIHWEPWDNGTPLDCIHIRIRHFK